MDLNAQKNKYTEKEKLPSHYHIEQRNKSILLYGFLRDSVFKHGEKTTDLITARVLENYEISHMAAPDTAKYICFEIPTELKFRELIDKKIFDILNQLGKFKNLEQQRYNHIGLIDKINGKYELFNPTKEVLKYVETKLDKSIIRNENLLSKRVKEFHKKYSVTSEKHEPFLEEQFRYKKGEQVYTNYKGIDVNTGRIININRLAKLEETPEEILYSAFIDRVDTDEKIDLKSLDLLPNGTPILFTSETPIEEICKNGEKEEMEKFLGFISNSTRLKGNENEMEFIGSLYKEGIVNKTEENLPEEIQEKIKQAKEQYREEKQQEEKQEEIERI